MGFMGFKSILATANGGKGEPGSCAVDFTPTMAGLGGRNGLLGFTIKLATANILILSCIEDSEYPEVARWHRVCLAMLVAPR
jgi:hypothetical protein